MPKMDPKQMAAMMKQMGITTKEVPATKVIIETPEEKIIIDAPQGMEITAQGESTFQVSGIVKREESISEEDVKLVMEKTGASQEEAENALKQSKGDIAEAILSLSNE